MSKEHEVEVAGTREEAVEATETTAHESASGAGADSEPGTDRHAGPGNGPPAAEEDRTRQTAEDAPDGEANTGEKPVGATEDAPDGEANTGEKTDGATEDAPDGEATTGEKTDVAEDASGDEQARLAKEALRYKDRLVRLAAEFDNYKKRTGREFTALVKNAGESLITELLPILDNIERALQAPQTSEETRSFAQGFEMIRQQFLEKLVKAGMKEISAAGEAFDPTLHEAVMAVDNEEHPADTVINVVEKGYTLNEKVLRAAKVIVTRTPAKTPDRDNGQIRDSTEDE